MSNELELGIGVFAIIFGCLAISLTFLAMGKLTSGHLRSYIRWIIVSISFYLASDIWHTAREWYGWKETYGIVVEYPEYIFAAFAYICLVIAAYKVYKLAELYGFKPEGDAINKLMAENDE